MAAQIGLHSCEKKREEKEGEVTSGIQVWILTVNHSNTPLRISHINQCQAVIRAPPISPLSVKSCVLTRVCCWGWQTTAGGKETEVGGREKRERERGKEKEGE